MFQPNAKISTLILGVALMMSACAHRDTSSSINVTPLAESSSATPSTTHYTVLEFQAGKTDLSSSEQEKIKNLTRVAGKTGRIVSEVRILAWADELTNQEPQLASQRATQVRSFLKADLHSRAPVTIYNMSQNPQKFTELIRDQDSKRKVTFENTESTSFGNGPKSSLAGNKASKAIVMIRYE